MDRRRHRRPRRDPQRLRPGPNSQLGYGTAVINPLGVPAMEGAAQVADIGFPVFTGILFIAGAVNLAMRARHTRATERAQVKWLVYAVSLAGLIVIARLVAGLRDGFPDQIWPVLSPFWELAGAAAMTLVLAAIGVAVLWYGLFDIEEERRRIRNDLHDGLGPTLAALTMRAEAVQDLVGPGPARELLEEIIGDAEAAVADVRALIEGLRPPALDSLGLLRALSSHVAGLPGELTIRIEAPAELPALPAATEVAAYHIAVEALANVRRHARASRAWLRLSAIDETLSLEVCDNGRGPEGKAGVGTLSMRDRAAELGGWCTIEPRQEGGTRVLAMLPARGGNHGTHQHPAR
ncbi:histidine kinase [Acrocarpospora sp. B8E8]|uniref:sensor histidine kinase n=1 Tax=Acrocarpospora sp. B8E8 TaxID=3153572 RepID=UPI00325EC64C